MFSWLKNLFTDKFIYSVVRKIMVLASGWLLSLGVPAEIVEKFVDSGTAVLVAVILYLLAQLWSVKTRAVSDA